MTGESKSSIWRTRLRISGGDISPAGTSDRDYWLIEALAEYSALLFMEARYPEGEDVVERVLRSYNGQVTGRSVAAFDGFSNVAWSLLTDRGRDRLPPLSYGPRLSLNETPNAYWTVVYRKGLLVMHMIRARAENDDRFFELLRRTLDERTRADGEPTSFAELVTDTLGGGLGELLQPVGRPLAGAPLPLAGERRKQRRRRLAPPSATSSKTKCRATSRPSSRSKSPPREAPRSAGSRSIAPRAATSCSSISVRRA